MPTSPARPAQPPAPAEEVVQTPFGRFLLTRGDLIDETLRAGTLWDGPGFLQPLAKEHGRLGEWGQTILDVGAHHGSFAIWLASQRAWRVVAVEPVPQTMLRLKANLDLNKPQCAGVVIPLEVAGYSERQLLIPVGFDPANTGGTALRPFQITDPQEPRDAQGALQGKPLDDWQYLWSGGLGLVKIDAQGCDGRVLRGLRETLAQHRPVVIFEWEEALAGVHGDRLEDTLDWLQVQGYQVHQWPSHPGNWVAIPRRG